MSFNEQVERVQRDMKLARTFNWACLELDEALFEMRFEGEEEEEREDIRVDLEGRRRNMEEEEGRDAWREAERVVKEG